MLAAILRKSLAPAQQMPHSAHSTAQESVARSARSVRHSILVAGNSSTAYRARSMRAQGERAGGDTIISLRHRTQRALVPTISQAGSPDTMSRRHFGQVYPAADGVKSYCGPT